MADMVQLAFELSADSLRRRGIINLAQLLSFELTPETYTLQITPMRKLRAMLTDEWWAHRNGPLPRLLFRADIRWGDVVHLGGD